MQSVVEAKNNLSALIDRALAGEVIIITRHGTSVVTLKPIKPKPPRINPADNATAHSAFTVFDAWCARLTVQVQTITADINAAEACICRLDTSLRTGDALHIAIAERLGATIATFDHTLTKAARARSVAVLC